VRSLLGGSSSPQLSWSINEGLKSLVQVLIYDFRLTICLGVVRCRKLSLTPRIRVNLFQKADINCGPRSD